MIKNLNQLSQLQEFGVYGYMDFLQFILLYLKNSPRREHNTTVWRFVQGDVSLSVIKKRRSHDNNNIIYMSTGYAVTNVIDFVPKFVYFVMSATTAMYTRNILNDIKLRPENVNTQLRRCCECGRRSTVIGFGCAQNYYRDHGCSMR